MREEHLVSVNRVLTLCSKVAAVAARSLENAKEFAQKHSIPRAYGSYEELARDPDIGEFGFLPSFVTRIPGGISLKGSAKVRAQTIQQTPNHRYPVQFHAPFADVVYIGVIHPYHLSTCLLFTNAKKNVLCEKPLAMNSKEVQEILASAKRNDVFLMEVGKIVTNKTISTLLLVGSPV